MRGVNTSRMSSFIQRTGRWSSSRAGAARSATHLILLVLFSWLYWPVFQYLAVLFSNEEFRTNQIVLAAVSGLLLYRIARTRPRLQLDAAPRLFLPGLALLILGSAAYLLVERFLDINTLSASLFVLASYGLLGLWLSPHRWRQGFAAMLLVVGILPFGAHLETFVGYPIRIFTANLVRAGLAGLGFHSVGVDTILVFESGISQIDIPCSGVKSLWTGALFLLSATWIENRRLNLGWLLVAAATGGLLLAANLLRVAVLALTGPALGWTTLARMLHLPLGVLGFAAACAASVFLLHRKPAVESSAPANDLRQPGWLGPLLVGCMLGMDLLYTPRAVVSSDQPAAAPVWRFDERLRVQPNPLSSKELAWIRQGGAEQADRYSFQWQNEDPLLNSGQPVTGTVMLLTSQTWRGQHQPERCFQVYGLTVRESYTYLVAPDFPLRYLSLSAPEAPLPVSAVYWLQSVHQITDDYGQRIWADLSPRRERWVLVTVLFDRETASQFAQLGHFFDALRVSVERSLTRGSVP